MVIYMEQWPRPGATIGVINSWSHVSYFEYCLGKVLPHGAWIWRWDKQMRFNEYFFAMMEFIVRAGTTRSLQDIFVQQL